MIGVILDGEGTGIGYGPVGTLRAFRVVAQTETYDPGQLDRVPTPIQRVAPLYPYEMKQRGIEGTVCLVLVVDDLGRVRELRVEGSAQIFHSVAGVSGRCQPRLIVVEVDDGERSLALRKADQIPRGAGTWRVRGMRGGECRVVLDMASIADSLLPIVKKSWSFNAMFILVLWLPATMHCGIEKVGVVADAFDCQSRAAESGTDGSHCADDVCDLVENGWIRAEILDTIVSVSPALLLEPVRFSDVFQTSPAIAEGSRVKVAREAEDWSVFWRFAARVTPPVRAPAGPV